MFLVSGGKFSRTGDSEKTELFEIHGETKIYLLAKVTIWNVTKNIFEMLL